MINYIILHASAAGRSAFLFATDFIPSGHSRKVLALCDDSFCSRDG